MNAYLQAIRKVREEKQRKKQFDALLITPMNYRILQDLVNSAKGGAEVTITLADGTKIEMRPERTEERERANRYMRGDA
jgi:hypothetical protein